MSKLKFVSYEVCYILKSSQVHQHTWHLKLYNPVNILWHQTCGHLVVSSSKMFTGIYLFISPFEITNLLQIEYTNLNRQNAMVPEMTFTL